MKNFLLVFVIANVLNVIIQTVKSIVTIKANKEVAAIVNAIAYGFYTYIIVLTTTDEIPMFIKALAVAICNLVGVYVVKLMEEKSNKEKLWSLQVTVPTKKWEICHELLKEKCIPHNYIDIGPHMIFNCYCYTKAQTKKALDIAELCEGKTFATESILR